MECPFCNSKSEIIFEEETVLGVFDKYPVTKFHALIIPKRHVSSFFELTSKEQHDCLIMLNNAQRMLSSWDSSISSFNVGINDGRDAGQTIPHCHIHLIPRRLNDVKDPRGGIRHVIPNKGNYDDIVPINVLEEKLKLYPIN